MNWDVVGAVGELAGAIGVIVSLLYLARQIGENTRATRRAASHESAQGLLSWFSHTLADPELTRIWTTGIEDLGKLSEEDAARFALLQFNLMKVAEDIHYQHVEGGMDAELWEGWHELWAQYLGAPGSKAYFGSRARLFSKSFRRYIEGLETDPDYLRTQSFARTAAQPSTVQYPDILAVD